MRAQKLWIGEDREERLPLRKRLPLPIRLHAHADGIIVASPVNLILLFDDDFISDSRVRLTGRRLQHVRDVHRAAAGESLIVGVANGRIGRGTITHLADDALEMDVAIDRDPPPPLPLTLILALPRPKVLNR